MGAKEGRIQFNKNVSANPEEIKSIKRILEKGVEMYYQLVPGEKAVDVKKFL